MLKVLAGSKKQESESEMKAEAYSVALEDVPSWAIDAAVRGWYRGSYGEKHDYTWPPAPATLRGLALFEAARLRGRSVTLRNLLAAEIMPIYTDEQREANKMKLAKIFGGFTKIRSVGSES